MAIHLMLVMVVLATSVFSQTEPQPDNAQFSEMLMRMEERLQMLEQEHKAYQDVVTSLARQISMQQFYVEEISRSSGDSGLKQSRLTHTGTRSYHSTSYSDLKVGAIHDHSNYADTMGMGELIVVLNGVEFRTRHNDYKPKMPSTTSKVYGATEDIPFPEVPKEVSALPTVKQQEEEMRLWFKAFRDQDYSQRDYRKYFKPILCYLEGMWTDSDGSKIDEPFESDRHFVDAESYFDLQDKAKFTSGTGRKDISENYAFLPTKLARMTAEGKPIYAQWNYKILCHPVKQDVPLWRLRLEDDLGTRVARVKTFDQARNERFARFSLWPEITGTKQFRKTKEGYTGLTYGTFLDTLMGEIPGKDNYMGDVHDTAFNLTVIKHDYRVRAGQPKRPPAKNVAFYHRLYRTTRKDAMGSEIQHRAFSDANLYIAYNTRSKITPNEVEWCRKNTKCAQWRANKGECDMKICSSWSDRVSYAIPLELIYLTPLHNWNPYNLPHSEYNDKLPLIWRTNGTYKRDGSASVNKAIYGSSREWFYRTPHTFFDGAATSHDVADTTRATMNVLDKSLKIRTTRASGVYIRTPNIPGVGSVRTRYPIMPVHQAGSFVFKEIDALKDITLEAAKYKRFYRDKAEIENGTLEEIFTFEIGMGDKSDAGPHYHTVELTESQIRELKSGQKVTALTSASAGHDHEITLEYRVAHYPNSEDIQHLFLTACDDEFWQCEDGHKGWVICNECMDRFPDI